MHLYMLQCKVNLNETLRIKWIFRSTWNVSITFSMFTEQGMFSSFKFKRVLVRRKNDKIRCRTENTTTKTNQKFLLLQTFHHKKYFGNVYDWFVTVFKRTQIWETDCWLTNIDYRHVSSAQCLNILRPYNWPPALKRYGKR